MADDSQLAEATQALSFAEFLERMKDPQAANLVRSIRNFIKTFDDKAGNPDKDAESVQGFLAKSEGIFRDHPVWANVPVEHQSQAMEGLEKYLMTKIYYKTFAQSELDRERDVALTQRMAALNFVQPHHLDIPKHYQENNASQLAVKELHKINNYKAPRDKLVCILNCCRVINNLLHVAGNDNNEARGADDFLPVLIYVVIHANPPQLASNLEYIQRFRMHSRMVSESAYFFTQLYSAASFIETINSSSLTMDSDEFVARMIAAGVPDIEAASTQPPSPKVKADPTPGSPRAGATLIPSAPEDNLGLANEPSQTSLANTPNKAPEAASARAASTGPIPSSAVSQGLAEPGGAEPGTYAATATPFQGGSHSILPPTPSISGQPSATLGSAQQTSASAAMGSSVPSQPEKGLQQPQQAEAEPWPSVAELEQEGVSQLVQSEAAGHLQQRYTFLYAQAPDLRMDDVPVLLRQYKELILKHEAVVSAIEAHRAKQQRSSAMQAASPAEASSSHQDSAAARTRGQSSRQVPAISPSPPQQAVPLDSARGSGASPFSQMSAQAAFSDNLDDTAPMVPATAQQPVRSPRLPEAHQPFGPTANSPFQQPSEQDTALPAQTSRKQEEAGTVEGHVSGTGGTDAASSGHHPSDAQVRNSLTAASQPLPPESTADMDAGTVDDRHMTMSSGSALEDAVSADQASSRSQGGPSPRGGSPLAGDNARVDLAPKGKQQGADSSSVGQKAGDESEASATAQGDMFSGLDVETSNDTA